MISIRGLSLLRSVSSRRRLRTCSVNFLSHIVKPSFVRTIAMGVEMGPTSMVFDSIEKSENDKRNYRGLILENGMKVLLINDSETDKASASLDVHVGFLSDPLDLQGLAHFCEHMLFLGTKKYPNEDEYHKFINQHGGHCNAYTSSEHTNYYFEVGHEHLKGALDRFSQFFICPLFDVCCSDREVNAVHSEHEKNVMSDAWRMQMLDRATCNPNHVYAKFGTGNKETLDACPKGKGQVVRDELLKFHEKYYSSNIMGLSIIGRESLDELADFTKELFSDAKNKNVQIPTYEESPYRPEDLKSKCHSIPVQDIRNLIVSFPIPDLQEYYDSTPCSYVAHLIGHEGPGSLLSELKSRGWVNSLVAGQKGGAKGFDFFLIQVDLTETGIDHVDDIIEIMMQYIKMLKKEGPQEWVHNEIKDVNAICFKFKDKEKPSSYVSKISQALHYFPMERVLTAGTILKESRPDIVEMILQKLTPDNMKVEVIAKTFEGTTDKVEKWYGTKYALVPIDGSIQGKWRNIDFNKKLRLPDRNEFIPSKLDLKPLPGPNPKSPRILKKDDYSLVWFKQDDTFKLPKAKISIEFYSPHAYVDPHHCNMMHLFTDLFNDALNEYSYAAEIAGLHYDLHNTVYGLSMSIGGYEDKQTVLLNKILMKLTDFKIDPQRFEILKEMYQRSLQNFHADQPYKHVAYYCQVVRSEVAWTKTELYDALPELTLQSLTAFIPVLLSHLHFEALMYGNVTKEDVRGISEMVSDILRERASTRPLLPSQLVRQRDIELPAKSSFVLKQKHTVRNNSAIQLYLQVGLQNTRENVLLELTSQIISEPYFTILRTKEQLGYVVHCGVTRSNSTQALRFIVQSDRSPNYLEARTEAYISHVESMLENMEEDEFNRHKSAMKTKRLEKPKKMKDQAAKYWGEIASKQYMFERDEIEMECLDGINKEEVINFYKEYFHVDAPKRAKLSVLMTGKDMEDCPANIDAKGHNDCLKDEMLKCPNLPPATVIEDIAEFKKTMRLFPRAEPYMDLVEVSLVD